MICLYQDNNNECIDNFCKEKLMKKKVRKEAESERYTLENLIDSIKLFKILI